MKRIWQVVNIFLIVSGMWGGYKATSPETLSRTNPDAILCCILLIGTPAFALGAVYYSKRRWDRDNKLLAVPFKLSRPSWSRNPINWWGDPLQSLFISTCAMGAMAIGASVRRPAIGSVGFWTFGVYCCVAIGLSAGQFWALRVFREYIAPPERV